MNINYPSVNHRNYINCVYEFCKNNDFSIILKGSLAKGTATKYSDIDLIVLGDTVSSKVDELITVYGNPIMTNFTENPKGILILVYHDNISVDLDIRESINKDDLEESIILLKNPTNFILDDIIARKQIASIYMPERPIFYKILRLLHRGIIKYLSNKNADAYDLLSEVKESLIILGINHLSYSNSFKDDMQNIYCELCKRFDFDIQIQILFNNLFKEFR